MKDDYHDFICICKPFFHDIKNYRYDDMYTFFFQRYRIKVVFSFLSLFFYLLYFMFCLQKLTIFSVVKVIYLMIID